MKENDIPDELDLALLDALQIAPRGSWRLIAGVLGISPITAARRWQQLTAARLAWVTVCGSLRLLKKTSLAVVAISLEAVHIQHAAECLLADPYTVNVAHTAGNCDLLLFVWTPDLATFARYVTERLNRLPGVRTVEVSLASEVYSDGSRWRLHALDPEQAHSLRQAAPYQEKPAIFRTEDRNLVVALSHNGRASYSELGNRVGTSAATVRRRLRRVLGNGAYVVRCEMSREISGFPVEVTLWLATPPDTAHAVGQRLARLPQTRLCATVVDNSNLVLVVWLRSTGEIPPLESEIVRLAPKVHITRRALTLRQLKLANRVLDDGRAGRVIPADVWRHEATFA